jgi:GntR family transcriptional regulator
MKVDQNSSVHPYLQLAASLRLQIEHGKIQSQLPSLTTLVKRTGLAVGTVRRAVEVLVHEDLVETVPGRGTFVKQRSAPSS